MALETDFSDISKLNPDWPTATDLVKSGDDHVRGIKRAVTQTFPNIKAPITVSNVDLNALTDSVKATASVVTVNKIMDIQNKNITNVATPTDATHAATKGYVDSNFQGKNSAGDVTVTGTLGTLKSALIGDATHSANLTVYGDATLTGGLTTNNGTVKSKNIHATDSAEVDGILTVGQLAQFKDGINITGTTTSTHYRATGNSQFDGDAGFGGVITVVGKITGKGGLDITGPSHLGDTTTGTLGAGSTNVSGNLGVNGQTTVVGKINAQSGIDSRYGYFNGSGDAGNARQGCHIVWNERVGDPIWSGATSVVNNYGSGNGGFIFRNVNSSNQVQRGEWGMAIQNDVASVYAQGTNGRTALRNVNGHSMDWYTGIGNNGAGQFYVQFGLDGGSKGINFFDSDERLKKNITDVPVGSALTVLDKIKPRSFDWKERVGHTNFGVIAQEMEKALPESVNTYDDGMKGMNEPALLGFLLAVVKDLKAEVDALKAKA